MSSPAMAAVHVAAAVNDLALAEDHLQLSIDALEDGQAGYGPAAGELVGMIETIRVFIVVLGPCADRCRAALSQHMVVKRVRDTEEKPDNLPGVERAAAALEFATASLEDAIEAAGDDPSAGCCVAAAHVFEKMAAAIEGSIVRGGRPDAGGLFGSN